MIALTIPVRQYRTGHDLKLVVNNAAGAKGASTRDGALIKLLARGRRWYEQFVAGEVLSVRDISKAENLDVARILYSSLLAPDIIEKGCSWPASNSLHGEVAQALAPDRLG